MSHPTIASDVDPHRLEPTVFGAVRRYRGVVLAVAILGMLAAVGYSLMQPKVYLSEASVTVPLPVSSSAAPADPGQYLDSQVLLLQSQGVAQSAADIADRELGSDHLDASDFYSNGGSLAVDPPTTAAAGSYGASIVAVSFKGPSREIAQVGLSAVLQAFDEAVSDAIRTQANATITVINKAIKQSSNPAQQAALRTQQAQTRINEQADLARTPTAAFGPTTRANGHWALDGAIGLVVGIILGAALAYVLAFRRRRIASRQDAAVIYGVPMIAETPALRAENRIPGGGLVPMAADPHSAAAEAFRFAAGAVERVCAAQGMPLSLVFVSPLAGAGKSTVIANLALAIAEGGTRLLVVDADAADGGLTARLLPGIPITEGFEQILGGQRTLSECIQPCPFNDAIAVLGSDPAVPRQVTGAARSRAARALLVKAKASFEIVLIDSPALLEVADATELVNAADAAIIVVNPNERIQDHVEMVDWLKSSGSDVVGYLYNRAQMRSYVSRHRRDGSVARPVREVRPSLVDVGIFDDQNRQPSQQPQR